MPRKATKKTEERGAKGEERIDLAPKAPVYPSIDPVRVALQNYFRPYQKDILDSRARARTLELPRQTGKSETIAADATLSSLDRDYPQVMLSGSQAQSNELMLKVQKWCKVMNLMVHDIEKEEMEYDGMKLIQRTAKLPKGRRIILVPANPSTAVGYSGDLYWDEAAKHKQQRAIWGAVAPIITYDNKRVTLSSTHEGVKTVFYKQCQNPIFEHHKLDIFEAVRQGCPVNIEETKAIINDDAIWAQDYLIIPQDESLAFLTYEQIHACERVDLSTELADDFAPVGPLYLGVDVARHRHLMVFWLVEELLGLFWTRAVVSMHNAPWKDIHATGIRLLSLPNLRRGCIDRTGIGDEFTERMQDKFGKHKVEGVTFSPSTKDKLASNFRQLWVQDRRIFIPVDADIVNDWHSVKRDTSAGGNVRYLCEEEDGGKGEGGKKIVHHADYFWAATLACDAAGHAGSGARVIDLSKPVVKSGKPLTILQAFASGKPTLWRAVA